MRTLLWIALILLISATIVTADQPFQEPIEDEYQVLFNKGKLRYPQFLELDLEDLSGYDVVHYTLDIQIFSATEELEGSVEMTATSVVPSLSQIDVDLTDPMNVSQVTRDGSPLSFTHNNDQIHINLGTAVAEGDTFTIEIHYDGDPQAGSLQGFNFDINNYGDTLISTLSQPEDARGWWPCKDIPSDKATANIILTIPDHFMFASNGLLTSVVNLGNGWKRWTWEESYPITTYLISLAICDYDTFSTTYTGLLGQTMPIQFFVYPQHLSQAQIDFSIIDDMIEYYADIWFEYPFIDEKYGHAIFEWGGGMEHQTMTSIGSNIVTGTHQYDWLYAHELAHMWWGDLVTCGTWADIWLNEGFATYSDALWQENIGGQSALQTRMSSFRTYYFNEDNQNRFPMYAPEIMWGSTVYRKGGWVCHMMRHVLGDSLYWEFFDEWGSRFAYDAVVTDDLTDVLSDIAGYDMEWFVHQWAYDAGYPEYQYAWESTDLGGGQWQVDVVIDQVQTSTDNTPIYKMPIDVDLYYNSSWHTFTIWDSLPRQHFRWTVDGSPTNLRFDYQQWILSTNAPMAGMPPETGMAYAYIEVDDMLGNGNHYSDPGESIDLTVAIQNTGWDDATGVSGQLSSTDPYITITADTSSYPAIAGYGIQGNLIPYVVEISSSCPVDYEADMDILMTADGGFSRTIGFVLPVGDPRMLQTGPDSYGYYALDMYDLEGPDYGWMEINPNEGGNGTLIHFTEDDETVQIALPFTFAYYGQSSDTLSVCSNGWVSPSVTTDIDYVNTGIPNAGGPAGMIAPFWEDLSPQEFGAVAYYYQSSQHRFVVEFYRTRQYYPNWGYETFQVMLYDPAHWTTVTGDGEIVFQYQSSDDLASCTVGIENWNEDGGIQYLYNGTYDNNAWEITDQFAVKFTTGPTYAVPEADPQVVPASYALYQNYPNPFNSQTVIKYRISQPGLVTLDVYNVLGQRINRLMERHQIAGDYTIAWDGKTDIGVDAASGIYFYRLNAGDFTKTKKMVLLK